MSENYMPVTDKYLVAARPTPAPGPWRGPSAEPTELYVVGSINAIRVDIRGLTIQIGSASPRRLTKDELIMSSEEIENASVEIYWELPSSDSYRNPGSPPVPPVPTGPVPYPSESSRDQP